MRFSGIGILACIPVLLTNLFAVGYNWKLTANFTFLLAVVILFLSFFKKLDWSNKNISFFLSLTALAGIINFMESPFHQLIILGIGFLAYLFLIREALRYTKRETANRFMLLFFFVLIAVNIYFLFGHLQEMETHFLNLLEMSFYSIYYINLLVLGIVGLVYYLNSYSRKSVYFISLVMALVLADVLRDMANFYLPVTSVLLLESFLRFGSLILAFKFLSTREKKLRLINLV